MRRSILPFIFLFSLAVHFFFLSFLPHQPTFANFLLAPLFFTISITSSRYAYLVGLASVFVFGSFTTLSMGALAAAFVASLWLFDVVSRAVGLETLAQAASAPVIGSLGYRVVLWFTIGLLAYIDGGAAVLPFPLLGLWTWVTVLLEAMLFLFYWRFIPLWKLSSRYAFVPSLWQREVMLRAENIASRVIKNQ